MAGTKVKQLSKPALQDFLLAALKFKSPEVRLALDCQPLLTVPTSVVRAEAAHFDVTPLNAETLPALFQEIASPAQRRQLKRDGRVRFIYTFETLDSGRQIVGAFRIHAKAANGQIVLLICENLRRYPRGH